MNNLRLIRVSSVDQENKLGYGIRAMGLDPTVSTKVTFQRLFQCGLSVQGTEVVFGPKLETATPPSIGDMIVAEVIEAPDAYFVTRQSGRFPIRVPRSTVLRQRTECERWFEIVDIQRAS